MAKNGTAKILATIAGVGITAASIIFFGGSRIGKTEAGVEAVDKRVTAVKEVVGDRITAVEARQDVQEAIVDDIRVRQARQEGKTDAKLEGLEKGQEAIMKKLDER